MSEGELYTGNFSSELGAEERVGEEEVGSTGDQKKQLRGQRPCLACTKAQLLQPAVHKQITEV